MSNDIKANYYVPYYWKQPGMGKGNIIMYSLR